MFDDLLDLRSCPRCKEPTAQLQNSTAHNINISAGFVPLGNVDQGLTLSYLCSNCHHAFTLLDKSRRAWMVYGIVVGLLIAAFGFWMSRGQGLGHALFAAGVIAFVFCAGAVVRDRHLRRSTRL